MAESVRQVTGHVPWKGLWRWWRVTWVCEKVGFVLDADPGCREVALEVAVEVVACNLTQGFGENGRICEAGYRACALEGAVEVVA